MKYSLAQDSRIGARHSNQDRVASWQTSSTLLIAVADGLGGHLYGEVAAQLAIELLGAAFQREAKPRLADPGAFLTRAMGAGHVAILNEAEKRRLPDTPRTVIVACVVQDGHAYWTHVGDCRLYLFRQARILHRTRDHTVVQELIDQGRIREEAISSHPERNRLLQCLGGYQAPRPDPAASARLAKGDVLVQRQMVHALLARPLDEAIPELVELAEQRAGRECDNVSVVAMTWGEDEVAAASEASAAPPYGAETEIKDLTATDLDFMRMSDEDIEKAIEELKASLRKNAPQ
jgi:serine/threonine protein phosphatase PrpC